MNGSDTARQRVNDLMLEFRIIAEQGGGEAVARRELCQRLVALLERVASLEAALQSAADALHDAAWIMEGAKTEPPLPSPISLVLPQTKRVEKELRALAAVGVPPEHSTTPAEPSESIHAALYAAQRMAGVVPPERTP